MNSKNRLEYSKGSHYVMTLIKFAKTRTDFGMSNALEFSVRMYHH